MILANKNKFACYYNNSKEKDELKSTLIEGECRIFSDYDTKKALSYANTKTIKGFRTNEMSSYAILKELEKEDTGIVEFKTRKGKHKIVVLNTTYFLCTRNYLEFDSKTNNFVKAEYRGYAYKTVENFINSIKSYASKRRMPLFLAIYQYISAFYKLYKFYPWQTIQASDFYFQENDLPFGEDDICFEYIGEDILENITNPKFEFSIKNSENNVRYREYEVNEIKELTSSFKIDYRPVIEIIETDFSK